MTQPIAILNAIFVYKIHALEKTKAYTTKPILRTYFNKIATKPDHEKLKVMEVLHVCLYCIHVCCDMQTNTTKTKVSFSTFLNNLNSMFKILVQVWTLKHRSENFNSPPLDKCWKSSVFFCKRKPYISGNFWDYST